MSFLTNWIKSALAFVGAFFSGFFTGAYREKFKQQERSNEANEKAKRIQDRVVLDDDYRQRVRDRFR